MKEYRKLLKNYDSSDYTLIEHKWGQTPNAVYNELVSRWNKAPSGHHFFIQSYKGRGVKRLASFLRRQGLEAVIVGKGPNKLRLIHSEKNQPLVLESLTRDRVATFTFLGNHYEANIGEATFSTRGLDKGTQFLLQTLLSDREKVAQGSQVADVGAGWGAISMVLGVEYQETGIVAFEQDAAACDAAKANLDPYPNVEFICSDIAAQVSSYRDCFDVVVSNPPFHATSEQLASFFDAVWKILNHKGKFYYVVEHSFEKRLKKAAHPLFNQKKIKDGDEFSVWECQK